MGLTSPDFVIPAVAVSGALLQVLVFLWVWLSWKREHRGLVSKTGFCDGCRTCRRAR